MQSTHTHTNTGLLTLENTFLAQRVNFQSLHTRRSLSLCAYTWVNFNLLLEIVVLFSYAGYITSSHRITFALATFVFIHRIGKELENFAFAAEKRKTKWKIRMQVDINQLIGFSNFCTLR